MKKYGLWILVLLLFSNGVAVEPLMESKARRNVILDIDTSGDDLMAILFLLSQPNIDIRAITVVNGVSNADAGTEIVLRLLTLTGRTDIPVAKGAAVPLEGKNAFPSKWQPKIDQPFGLVLPLPGMKASELSAREMISKLIKDFRGDISILALGPLTNIAGVFLEKPELIRFVEKIYISDGAVYVKGAINIEYPAINNSVSGWNLWVDAKAASIVFGSGAGIILVPLDLTAVHGADPLLLKSGIADQLNRQAVDKVKKSLASLMINWIDYYFTDTGILGTEDRAPLWDVVAAVIYINPDVCAAWEQHAVQIKTENPETAGQIVIAYDLNPNVSICLKGNQSLFDAILLQ